MRLVRAVVALLVALGTIVAGNPLPSSQADGPGEIRVSDAAAGPYRLTVATNPSPLMVGVATVNVLVQDERRTPVLDTEVTVAAWAAGQSLAPVRAQPGVGANRLLYLASVPVERAGAWQFVVRVTGSQGSGETGFAAEVQPASAAPPIGPVLLLLLPSLVVLVGFLLRRRRQGLAGSVDGVLSK